MSHIRFPLLAFRLLAFVVATHVLLGVAIAQTESSSLRQGVEHFNANRFAEARQAFFRGVEADDAACMDWLGFMYLEGFGEEPKPYLARGLFQEAAERGNVDGCRNLGTVYYLARYVEPDMEKAIHWLEKAVEMGSPRAAFTLGQIYWIGDGIEPNRELAKRIWKQAAELGSVDAEVALAAVQTNKKLLEQLAGQGNEVARGTVKFFALQADGKPMIGGIHFLAQGWNFCGVASSTMLCQFNGGKLCQYDFARQRQHHRWAEGSRWNELADVAAKQGQKWTIEDFPVNDSGFDDALALVAEKLKAGQPVVLDIREDPANPGAHSILACGIDPESGELLVRNPALPFPGFQVFSQARLKEVWHSQGYLEGLREPRRAIMFAERK